MDAKIESNLVVDKDMNMFLNDDGFCLIFPIRTTGMYRLIGIVPEEMHQKEFITSSDIQPFIESVLPITFHQVNWFSTYQSHHRVTEQFQKGRVFLLGDAAHIHSPFGGQGMNTGIGDAINLAWKLASVIKNPSNQSLLDSYNVERLSFAKLLVSTTDLAFKMIVSKKITGTLIRNLLFPHVFPTLLKVTLFRKGIFRLVSQTRINYRRSSLSKGTTGKIRSGDRLPWVRLEGTDNYAPLISCNWQIHIYGEPLKEIQEFAESISLPLYTFPFPSETDEAGLKQNALYLIRPDGYIAFCDKRQSVNTLQTYIENLGISTQTPAT
jgi:hypothetical protein